MLFEWVKSAYRKNGTVVFMLVVIIMHTMINSLETYILERIALVSRRPDEYKKYDSGNFSCPYFPNKEEDQLTGQQTSFYWTEQQKVSVQYIRMFSPALTTLFGGIYADQYGGHRVVLVGLVLCAVIKSTLYLVVFNNNNIFIAMLILRRASEGAIWAALFSLAGKLAASDQRTIFVSVLFAGERIGGFLAYVVSRIVVKWKLVSQFSGFMGFVAAVWWWMICRSSRFPKVHRLPHIPWKHLLTSFSLYVILLLNFSPFVYQLLMTIEYQIYVKEVLFFHADPEWVTSLLLCLTDVFSNLFCGASSDYIISSRLLPVLAVRRGFVTLSAAMLFCLLLGLRLAGCDRVVAVGCSVALRYCIAIAWSTTATAVLDFTPSCSGAVTGIISMFAPILKVSIVHVLFIPFFSGESKGNIIRWSKLLFSVAFLGSVVALPFICCGIKEMSPGDETVLHRVHRNVQLDSAVSKNARGNKQHILQNADPGPSNR